jgi:hypothetical protein
MSREQDVQAGGIHEHGIAQVQDHGAGAFADDSIQLCSQLRSGEDVDLAVDVNHGGFAMALL